MSAALPAQGTVTAGPQATGTAAPLVAGAAADTTPTATATPTPTPTANAAAATATTATTTATPATGVGAADPLAGHRVAGGPGDRQDRAAGATDTAADTAAAADRSGATKDADHADHAGEAAAPAPTDLPTAGGPHDGQTAAPADLSSGNAGDQRGNPSGHQPGNQPGGHPSDHRGDRRDRDDAVTTVGGLTDAGATVISTSPAAGTSPGGTSSSTAPAAAQSTPTTTGATPTTGVAAPLGTAGAATTGAHTGSSPSGVTGQVLPEVARLVTRGDGTQRVTVKLAPEALGEVRIILTVRRGEVQVRMTGSETAQRALLQGQSDLHRLLASVGATASSVQVGDAAATLGTSPSTGHDNSRGDETRRDGATPDGTTGSSGQTGADVRRDAPGQRPADLDGGAGRGGRGPRDDSPAALPTDRVRRGTTTPQDPSRRHSSRFDVSV